jgi:hypothetical protein
MIFLEILVSVVVLLTVATVGTLCLIRPREIVNREQRLYQKSKFFRLNPFLFRPWYPSYLRAMGIVAWAFVLLNLVLWVALLTGHQL